MKHLPLDLTWWSLATTVLAVATFATVLHRLRAYSFLTLGTGILTTGCVYSFVLGLDLVRRHRVHRRRLSHEERWIAFTPLPALAITFTFFLATSWLGASRLGLLWLFATDSFDRTAHVSLIVSAGPLLSLLLVIPLAVAITRIGFGHGWGWWRVVIGVAAAYVAVEASLAPATPGVASLLLTGGVLTSGGAIACAMAGLWPDRPSGWRALSDPIEDEVLLFMTRPSLAGAISLLLTAVVLTTLLYAYAI